MSSVAQKRLAANNVEPLGDNASAAFGSSDEDEEIFHIQSDGFRSLGEIGFFEAEQLREQRKQQ